MSEDYDIYKEGGLLRGRYKKLDDISEGSYGYVSLANDTKTKKLVAVKYIFKSDSNDSPHSSKNGSLDSEEDEKLNQLKKHQKSMISEKVRSRLSKNVCFEALYEVDIHTKVGKHKNITELFDFFDSFIIMEYCSGGDLYEAIRADLVPKKTKMITHIASQIMEAIDFVHQKGIYHRDVKPENILIEGSDWTIKLTDWGLATTEETSSDRSVGSERYMSPELFEDNLDRDEGSEPYVCSKVDIWAIGIVMLNLVFHKNPFSVANQTDKSFCYFAANREALFDIFSTMSFDFFQVLRHSLTIDPSNRDLSSMKRELLQLGEYTLDDDYYNSLTDDGYSPTKLREDSTTPMSTSTTPITVTGGTEVNVPQISVEEITPAASINEKPREKEPVPKFTFTKRSHPQRDSGHKRANPIKIDGSDVLKNSRKPLAIPTPNTHINNFFQEYHAKENDDFNTRDFFTPPSVHNRYMEGIFSTVGTKNRGHKNRRPSSNSNQKSTPKANGSHLSASYGRRGSTISQTSPSGKYIPPHSRPSSLHNGSPNIPTITSVLGGDKDSTNVLTKNTYHEQHAMTVDNNENDLDDVLFTLEENDIDSFTNDLDGLLISNETLKKPLSGIVTVEAPASGSAGDFPDLLKSPVLKDASLKESGTNTFFEELRQQAPVPSSSYKHKPGVYVPPHHRKSFNGGMGGNQQLTPQGGETTLSVGRNSISYGGFNTRRRSSQALHSDKASLHGRSFMARNHGQATTEVQSSDIFADSNAVVFEDDEVSSSPFASHNNFQPTSYNSFKSARTGRKSSSIQDELIGSLEQYKNNWLMLQQQD
ncbi:LAME_0F14158g1_1 [Lachancea meyersii CBS 8951]|uniref:non-specific serine/threonine protein kinase n=1 Tax=Lachancea meyersii CBS 8951 TaxID=1266667 RepID=A0A1G4JXS5_9SACH|nr:LAME_0F14158g1_1 [Lachancea meyersii CBS 8951]